MISFKAFSLFILPMFLIGCETDWNKTELSKQTNYTKEYGIAYIESNQENFGVVCLDGVEYWKKSSRLAVKYKKDGNVSICNLDNLQSFQKYIKWDASEHAKWFDSK